jgi:hypothetical protein
MIPAALREALLANGRRTAAGETIDPYPIVKIFALDSYAIWLLTEIDPDDPDRAYGLCDPGLGHPELGYVSLRALESHLGRLGLPLRVDRRFLARKRISEYAADARVLGRIVA